MPAGTTDDSADGTTNQGTHRPPDGCADGGARSASASRPNGRAYRMRAWFSSDRIAIHVLGVSVLQLRYFDFPVVRHDASAPRVA
jgi:hypothetical protein